MTTSSDAAGSAASASGSVPSIAWTRGSLFRSSASATSQSTALATSPRIVRENAAWKPQPKSPTRLPAKVGT